VLTRTDIASNVNRFVRQFRADIGGHDFGRREPHAHNMGYTTMRGAVLRMTVLCKVEHLCFVLKFGGNNPALRVAQKRYLQGLGDSANVKRTTQNEH